MINLINPHTYLKDIIRLFTIHRSIALLSVELLHLTNKRSEQRMHAGS